MTSMARADERYVAAAIVLHWTIALLIVIQLFLGWWLNEWVPDHSKIQDQITTVHVSVGLTILLLVLVRIGVRLTRPAPPPPTGTPMWQRVLAASTHFLFYALMLILPLSGWAIESFRPAPIHFWGLPWPHLPGMSLFGSPPTRAMKSAVKHFHVFVLIWIVVLNLALHVVAAVWHQFDGRPVLQRMWPAAR